jgi:prophage endopeptidase
MAKYLMAAIVALLVSLTLALLRLDSVSGDLAVANKAVKESESRVASLRETVRLSRQVMLDQAATEVEYLKEKQDAEDEAERLRRCIADGTCRLQVNATCVRMGGAGAATGQPDAGTPELTAAAKRAYPALVAGLKEQRAQIIGLQEALTNLRSACKIIGAGDG